MQRNVDKLQCWANEANLVLNPSKTKYMLLSSSKRSSYHELDNIDIDLLLTLRDSHSPQSKMGRKCQANFSFLLSHSWNFKEIEEFSSIPYSQAASSGPSTFQVEL